MTTGAAVNRWTPRPPVAQVWGLRGTTAWCDVCQRDTTHNGAGHRAGRHQREPS
jgi:hypothetical protein